APVCVSQADHLPWGGSSPNARPLSPGSFVQAHVRFPLSGVVTLVATASPPCLYSTSSPASHASSASRRPHSVPYLAPAPFRLHDRSGVVPCRWSCLRRVGDISYYLYPYFHLCRLPLGTSYPVVVASGRLRVSQ
ncbi:hypothetical protein EDB84DRAFT_1578734, partial [Lactarius hengduanensis]